MPVIFPRRPSHRPPLSVRCCRIYSSDECWPQVLSALLLPLRLSRGRDERLLIDRSNMPGKAAIMSVPLLRYKPDNTMGALWLDKSRSYCCNHHDDIGRHVGPLPTERHGVECCVYAVAKCDEFLCRRGKDCDTSIKVVVMQVVADM